MTPSRFDARPVALAVLLATVPAWALAQATKLAPQADRISDEVIRADQQAYESVQNRIKGLNDRGRPVRDYHLSKAQCWLDVSFHEYTRNDRSDFPQAALTESDKLVKAMERPSGVLPMDTPLVNGAAKLRPDLWERAAALKSHLGYPCAQQKLACAEVELVHAGNEYNQQRWRHAKPYVQIAEDLLGEADAAADRCEPPAAPVLAAAPVAAPTPAPVVAAAASAPVPLPLPAAAPAREAQLAAGVLFNFDKHDAANMRPFSVVQLEQLVERIKREKMQVRAIRLAGHADRLNGTGNAAYNQGLSEKRVATVKAELVKLGIAPELIRTAASGDTQQVQGCAERFKNRADLQECLLPNRRVEVTVDASLP